MEKQQSSPNFQDSPHKEGTQNNTPPQGQPREGSNPQTQSTMNQDSQEQREGRDREPREDQGEEQ